MTKVKILTEASKLEKSLKPIQFKYMMDSEFHWYETEKHPNTCKEIILLEKKYGFMDGQEELDLFIVVANKERVIYLGHFNDGVVE